MSVEVQNKRQTRYGIIYSDEMRRLFVGTEMTKEVTFLDEDLGQIRTVEKTTPGFGTNRIAEDPTLFTIILITHHGFFSASLLLSLLFHAVLHSPPWVGAKRRGGHPHSFRITI